VLAVYAVEFEITRDEKVNMFFLDLCQIVLISWG